MDLVTILESLPNPISFLKKALDFQQEELPKELLPKKEKKQTLREHFNLEELKNNLPAGLLHAVSGTEVGTMRDPLSARSLKSAIGIFQHTPIFQKEYNISREEFTTEKDLMNPVLIFFMGTMLIFVFALNYLIKNIVLGGL